jgi:hypothetical protein
VGRQPLDGMGVVDEDADLEVGRQRPVGEIRVAQTRLRLSGRKPDSATRIVSLHDLGVKTVAIPRRPRKGKTTPAPRLAPRQQEHRPGFRKLVKWRTGAEGRISHLKHGCGLARAWPDWPAPGSGAATASWPTTW